MGLCWVGAAWLGNRARQEFARVAAAGRWCGACHITTRHNINMALRHWGVQGDNFGVQCGPGVSKKPRFTHVRGNLGGDVSRKRFNTHVMERNVDRIVEGQCGNDKGMESASGEQ